MFTNVLTSSYMYYTCKSDFTAKYYTKGEMSFKGLDKLYQ